MNIKAYLPTTELSKYSSTRDTMEWLIGQTPQSGLLDQARDILMGWASESCQGQGYTDRFALLDPDKDISFHEVLSQMDPDQAQRFINELIEDIVPQIASQRQLLDDIQSGHTPNGANVQGNHVANVMAGLAGALEELGTLDEIRELFSSMQTQVQRLTWVDDHKRNAQINMDVQFQVDEDINKEPGRSLKF